MPNKKIEINGGNVVYEILGKVPLFQDLSRREFERLRGILHRRSFSTDEAIVTEGDMGVGMYVILSGEVAILQEGVDGKMIELATFGEGDFFGDQVLLDASARTARSRSIPLMPGMFQSVTTKSMPLPLAPSTVSALCPSSASTTTR